MDPALFARLRARLPDDLKDPVGFLYVSGWRVNKMRRLEWRDVDLSAGLIRLRAELAKNGRERIVPLRGELARIIGRAARRRTYKRSDGTLATATSVFHVEGRPLGDFGKLFRIAAVAPPRRDFLPAASTGPPQPEYGTLFTQESLWRESFLVLAPERGGFQSGWATIRLTPSLSREYLRDG